MKIKRLKLLSPFRGLPEGYEVVFRDKISEKSDIIDPICLIGLNGSGKSNVLEVFAEIFYYLETYHKAPTDKLDSFKKEFGFEIEYQLSLNSMNIQGEVWNELNNLADTDGQDPIVQIVKNQNQLPLIFGIIGDKKIQLKNSDGNRNLSVLPINVIAYSSGMNELLSNPFIKIDFQYFDDFKRKMKNSARSSLDMNRLFFLNEASYKVMTLSNFLFDADDFDMSQFHFDSHASEFGGVNLGALKSELKIRDLHSFKIKLKLNKGVNEETYLPSELNINLDSLKRCATFIDEKASKTKNEDRLDVELFFWVNRATKEAFRQNFKTPIMLFRAFYFFQLLNIELISLETRKTILSAKTGAFENLSDEIPRHESDKLMFRISNLEFKKAGGIKVNYRKFSDGEHQLLQILGSLLILDNEGALFLFDEPETHFNPDWRSKLIQLINKSVEGNRKQEIILTTHSPYIVSDCKKENVFIFKRDEKGRVCKPDKPRINTFGSSIGIITDEVFGKEDTISELSKKKISEIEQMPLNSLEDIQAAKEASRVLGESAEKVLLFKKLIMREKDLKK